MCLCVSLSVCPSVRLSICLSVCLSPLDVWLSRVSGYNDIVVTEFGCWGRVITETVWLRGPSEWVYCLDTWCGLVTYGIWWQKGCVVTRIVLLLRPSAHRGTDYRYRLVTYVIRLHRPIGYWHHVDAYTVWLHRPPWLRRPPGYWDCMVASVLWLQTVVWQQTCVITEALWSPRPSCYRDCAVPLTDWFTRSYGYRGRLVTGTVWLQRSSEYIDRMSIVVVWSQRLSGYNNNVFTETAQLDMWFFYTYVYMFHETKFGCNIGLITTIAWLNICEETNVYVDIVSVIYVLYIYMHTYVYQQIKVSYQTHLAITRTHVSDYRSLFQHIGSQFSNVQHPSTPQQHPHVRSTHGVVYVGTLKLQVVKITICWYYVDQCHTRLAGDGFEICLYIMCYTYIVCVVHATHAQWQQHGCQLQVGAITVLSVIGDGCLICFGGNPP